MAFQQIKLPGGIYLVATPLGSARDITLRALDVLASADVLVAEDTRVLRRLLELHGIPLNGRKVWSYHDHSGPADRTRLVDAAQSGLAVAYTSDAGTPLIADPGYQLVQDAVAKDVHVTSLPGPSAAINALVLGGLPTHAFSFAGFLPPQAQARTTALQSLRGQDATLVIYETPNRLAAFLSSVAEVFGPDHPTVICREMTKQFETVYRGTVQSLIDAVPNMVLKGEVVVLIGPSADIKNDETEIDAALINALLTMRVKDAAHAVAGALGLPKRDVYQRALQLKSELQD